MSSEDVAKAVAKRLKFYLDTQRREDAFDLSGPQHPEQDHPVLTPGSSLAYEGLHDRSLKHYYRQKNVKQQLQKMKTVDGLGGREKQVKKKIEKTMKNYNYTLSPSPYSVPLIHPRDTSQDFNPHPRNRKGARKKKHLRMVVGKSPKIDRRAPDEIVSLHEKERLVNMATKLIVATETIALPQNRRRTKGNQTNSQERLPLVLGGGIERRTSSASDPGPRAVPQPPRYQQHSRKGHHPVRKWNDASSGEISLDSTLGSIRSQMQHLKLDSKGNGYIVSHEGHSNATPTDGIVPSQATIRPKSAGDKLSPNQTDSDYEDFYDRASSNVSPLTSPRAAWKSTGVAQSVDNATQTVESRGTQTAAETFSPELQTHNSNASSRTSSRHVSFDHSVASSGTQVEEAVQAVPAEPKVVAYEIFVVTGNKLGAGTSSDVKINLFGQFGDSGDRPLIRSKSNKNPFERKQVDLFIIDSIFLGDLTSIRIGHNGTALGTGWFLDRVVVREGEESQRAFEFKCWRWFSARDDDGQIVRDLSLSNTLQGNEVPQVKDAKRTYFKYRPDSASSSEGGKLHFRPLSATEKKDSDLKEKNIVPTRNTIKEDSTKLKRQYFTANSSDHSTDDEESSTKDGGDGGFISGGKDLKEDKPEDAEAEKISEDARGREWEATGNEDDKETTGKNVEAETKRKVKKKKEKKKSDDEKGKVKEEPDQSRKSVTNKKSKSEEVQIVPNAAPGGEEEREGDQKEKKKEDVRLDFPETETQVMDEVNKEELMERTDVAAELEITPTEENVTEAEKIDDDGDDDSRSDESSSSSDSELFSVSSDSSSSTNSDDEETKTAASDEEEEVERVPTDTTKKEDSDSESRKTSGQDDYMAGFMAAVKAQKETIHEEEPKESILTNGLNIHQASENGDFDRIKELIAEVPDLKSKPDERGWTPLHIVSAFGFLEILKWLSVNGVNLSEETPTGFSAIHLAAMNGHVKCLMVLAAMGCSLNCKTVDDSTPLHLAAMSGHVECIKWLLANRANHNVRDANGRTPLDIATEYQHESCAELLELIAVEMTRKDSVISILRHPNMKENGEKTSGSSKGTDSVIEGVESGEEAWVSDTEEEVVGRGDRVQSAKSRGENFAAAKARKKSKQEERAMEEMEEKRKLYEKQKNKMQRRESSFLDSIRQEVDSDDNNDDF